MQPTNERYNLMSVIMIGVQEGGITPYNPESDDFKVPLTKEDVQNIIRKEEKQLLMILSLAKSVIPL